MFFNQNNRLETKSMQEFCDNTTGYIIKIMARKNKKRKVGDLPAH
jgi:hypothetical protein